MHIGKNLNVSKSSNRLLSLTVILYIPCHIENFFTFTLISNLGPLCITFSADGIKVSVNDFIIKAVATALQVITS